MHFSMTEHTPAAGRIKEEQETEKINITVIMFEKGIENYGKKSIYQKFEKGCR